MDPQTTRVARQIWENLKHHFTHSSKNLKPCNLRWVHGLVNSAHSFAASIADWPNSLGKWNDNIYEKPKRSSTIQLLEVYPKAIQEKKKTYTLENVCCSGNKGALSLLVQLVSITLSGMGCAVSGLPGSWGPHRHL